jgi:hypothetical protein
MADVRYPVPTVAGLFPFQPAFVAKSMTIENNTDQRLFVFDDAEQTYAADPRTSPTYTVSPSTRYVALFATSPSYGSAFLYFTDYQRNAGGTGLPSSVSVDSGTVTIGNAVVNVAGYNTTYVVNLNNSSIVITLGNNSYGVIVTPYSITASGLLTVGAQLNGVQGGAVAAYLIYSHVIVTGSQNVPTSIRVDRFLTVGTQVTVTFTGTSTMGIQV